MQFDRAIGILREKLAGRPARRLELTEFIPAAILIPFFEKKDAAHLLLTVRTDTVEHHKGQVSFPGGARESDDKGLQHTALRETEEEVGISPGVVEIIGQLDDFPTITRFLVTPYVATIPHPYPYRINTGEVAEVLEVPLEIFLDERHFEIKEREFDGKTYPIYYYYYEHAVIWGVTGFIINRFIEQVYDFNPAPRSIHSDPQNEEYLLENIRRRGIRKPPRKP